VLAAGLAKFDPNNRYITDVLLGERHDEDSITMAVEWPRHMRTLGGLDEKALLVEFGLEASRILSGHPEMPSRTAVDLMLSMYRRQSDAVHAVLRNATSERADDLARQRLPATSLICLHFGQSTELPETPRVALERLADLDEIEEVDVVLRPEAPLRVKFLIEDRRYIVDVVGIGTVRGQPARVPHALKPAFDEDRSRGLGPMDHRYLIAVGLPLLEGQNKRAIRKSIERCRESLAEDYERVFGKRPDRHLLIETKPSKGYRLDPDIDVVDSNH
jgi:hypothetical protein